MRKGFLAAWAALIFLLFLKLPATAQVNITPGLTAMVFDVAATTDVIAVAATPSGCSGSDTMRIIAEPCCHLNVATAFTPNGDGRNDVLRVVGERGAKVSHFRIYNRWVRWCTVRQAGMAAGMAPFRVWPRR